MIKTQAGQIEERLKQIPKPYRSTYRKAMRGRSLRAAVNSYCLECVWYSRDEVKKCPDKGCPLYPYRPYK